jgi:hypothetical protein
MEADTHTEWVGLLQEEGEVRNEKIVQGYVVG